MTDNIKERIISLRNDLKKYSDYYYEHSTSLISDMEYDMLMKELERLETEYPEYKTPDSPTQIVGASDIHSRKFTKVRHKKPMLSLENTYSLEDMVKWTERVEKLLKAKEDC